MPEKKVRSKHIGYNAQREQCRLNKYTYIEKVNGAPVLFCNYPFTKPEHKKGICKASTCTDMREIPADIVAADNKVEVPGEREVSTCKEVDANTLADSGEGQTEDATKMPCPKNE